MFFLVCDAVKTSVDKGETPDLVIDTTKSGMPSEVAKAVTKSLAIPTLSTSYGLENDLRYVGLQKPFAFCHIIFVLTNDTLHYEQYSLGPSLQNRFFTIVRKNSFKREDIVSSLGL